MANSLSGASAGAGAGCGFVVGSVSSSSFTALPYQWSVEDQLAIETVQRHTIIYHTDQTHNSTSASAPTFEDTPTANGEIPTNPNNPPSYGECRNSSDPWKSVRAEEETEKLSVNPIFARRVIFDATKDSSLHFHTSPWKLNLLASYTSLLNGRSYLFIGCITRILLVELDCASGRPKLSWEEIEADERQRLKNETEQVDEELIRMATTSEDEIKRDETPVTITDESEEEQLAPMASSSSSSGEPSADKASKPSYPHSPYYRWIDLPSSVMYERNVGDTHDSDSDSDSSPLRLPARDYEINTLRILHYGSYPLLGATLMSGDIVLYDLQSIGSSTDIPPVIRHCHRSNCDDNSVWSIASTPIGCQRPLIATGTNAHCAFLWELENANKTPRSERPHGYSNHSDEVEASSTHTIGSSTSASSMAHVGSSASAISSPISPSSVIPSSIESNLVHPPTSAPIIPVGHNLPSLDFSSCGRFIAMTCIDHHLRIGRIDYPSNGVGSVSGSLLRHRAINSEWGWSCRWIRPQTIRTSQLPFNRMPGHGPHSTRTDESTLTENNSVRSVHSQAMVQEFVNQLLAEGHLDPNMTTEQLEQIRHQIQRMLQIREIDENEEAEAEDGEDEEYEDEDDEDDWIRDGDDSDFEGDGMEEDTEETVPIHANVDGIFHTLPGMNGVDDVSVVVREDELSREGGFESAEGVSSSNRAHQPISTDVDWEIEANERTELKEHNDAQGDDTIMEKLSTSSTTNSILNANQHESLHANTPILPSSSPFSSTLIDSSNSVFAASPIYPPHRTFAINNSNSSISMGSSLSSSSRHPMKSIRFQANAQPRDLILYATKTNLYLLDHKLKVLCSSLRVCRPTLTIHRSLDRLVFVEWIEELSTVVIASSASERVTFIRLVKYVKYEEDSNGDHHSCSSSSSSSPSPPPSQFEYRFDPIGTFPQSSHRAPIIGLTVEKVPSQHGTSECLQSNRIIPFNDFIQQSHDSKYSQPMTMAIQRQGQGCGSASLFDDISFYDSLRSVPNPFNPTDSFPFSSFSSSPNLPFHSHLIRYRVYILWADQTMGAVELSSTYNC